MEKDVFTEGEIGKFVLSRGKYAVGRFELRETDFEKAWNTMCSWLSESGYQPGDGCTYELYHNHYNPSPEHIYIVDIVSLLNLFKKTAASEIQAQHFHQIYIILQ